MTLIEKLEELYKYWCEREDNSVHGGVGALDARGRNRGIKDCIDIVKSHSDWVAQETPPPDKSRVLAFDGRREFICLYDKGYYILANGEYYGCVTHWQNLPTPPHEPKGGAYERDLYQIQKQPPSEVQSVNE